MADKEMCLSFSINGASLKAVGRTVKECFKDARKLFEKLYPGWNNADYPYAAKLEPSRNVLVWSFDVSYYSDIDSGWNKVSFTVDEFDRETKEESLKATFKTARKVFEKERKTQQKELLQQSDSLDKQVYDLLQKATLGKDNPFSRFGEFIVIDTRLVDDEDCSFN